MVSSSLTHSSENLVGKRRGVQSRFKSRSVLSIERASSRTRSSHSDIDYLPKTNLINRKPTPEDLRINHLATLPHQTMYIMADLSDRIDAASAQLIIGPPQVNEHLLCTIRVFANGTILLSPDFNNGKMAYIVETGNLNNEVYHYYLEHASVNIQTDDLLKERKLFHEVCQRQQTYLSQMVGNEFKSVGLPWRKERVGRTHASLQPPPMVLQLNVFGEIVSGKNFECDDLYVYYSLDLPESK